MNNIYVGWDSREDIAYQVCEHSILRRTYKEFINVIPLKQNDLREQKVYWRDVDKLASTEFTFTRFLIPHLNNYKGLAVFCDSDMVFLTDAYHLFENGFKNVFLGPYGIPHAYKCQAKKFLNFSFLATTIPPHTSSLYCFAIEIGFGANGLFATSLHS